MIDAGTLHATQALAGEISSAYGITNRPTILGGDQFVSRAEHTSEPRLDLGQQTERGFTATGAHPADTGTVKIKNLGNPGQRGRQKGGMPPPKQKPTKWMEDSGYRARNQLSAEETSPRI